MRTVAYGKPFIPPGWIAAHGLRPQRLCLRPASPSASHSASPTAARGVCPYAGAMVEAAMAGLEAAALVLTTVCDQMRYASALLVQEEGLPVFLFNVPSTWQTAAARHLYRDELERLGRFLVRLGGQAPSHQTLVETLLAYDEARREQLTSPPSDGRIRLALVGGPLLDRDDAIFEMIEQAGGRVVLDATEGGQRTLPAPLDPQRLDDDPLDELTRAYFDTIPDVFRRPNDRLYEWLGQMLAARGVQGILVRRYLWCDLWHAEVQRLRAWSPVPLLEIDIGRDEQSALNRTQGRLEAFLEMLR